METRLAASADDAVTLVPQGEDAHMEPDADNKLVSCHTPCASGGGCTPVGTENLAI